MLKLLKKISKNKIESERVIDSEIGSSIKVMAETKSKSGFKIVSKSKKEGQLRAVYFQKSYLRMSYLRMFYQVLTVLFIIGILGFTYFLADYIFSPAIDSSPVVIQSVSKSFLKQVPFVSTPNFLNSFNSSLTTPNASLVFSAYFDDFANSFYLNPRETTLYRDNFATAIMFPPKYSLTDASSLVSSETENSFNSPIFNNFKGPYNDRRCLQGNCLVQKGKVLYYNGKKLNLPSKLNSASLVAISIGALDKEWLIGATLKIKEGYQGLVFSFNGSKFTEINISQKVSSPYFGLWGFGGVDNDFLMIYGSYEGIAYRVHNNSVYNISRFFSIRAMNGGFKAEIIRVVFGENITWYIYSSSLNHPWFFKLWQNGTGKIVGEVFFNNAVLGDSKSVAFKLLDAGSQRIQLLEKVRTSSGVLIDKVFTDYGFDNSHQSILTTTHINNPSLHYQIMIRKIYDVNLNLDAQSRSAVKFLFSNDRQHWQSLIGRSNTNFDEAASPFYLKVVFPAEKDHFYSPYLDSMLFSYYWRQIKID